MGGAKTALGAFVMLLAGGAGGAALAANEGGFLKRIFSGIEPKERVATGAGAAAILQEAAVGFADNGAKESRKSALAPAIKEELRNRPGDIYVVEVIVPASGENTERPIDPQTITPMGPGTNLWDALARANTVRAGPRPSAIDYKRSRFLIATLVDGELYWREVLVPPSDVLRERVAAAQDVLSSGAVPAGPASNQPDVSRASISTSTTSIDPSDRSEQVDRPTSPSPIDTSRPSTTLPSNSAQEETLPAGQSAIPTQQTDLETKPKFPSIEMGGEFRPTTPTKSTTPTDPDPGPHSPDSSGDSSSGGIGSDNVPDKQLPADTYSDDSRV